MGGVKSNNANKKENFSFQTKRKFYKKRKKSKINKMEEKLHAHENFQLCASKIEEIKEIIKSKTLSKKNIVFKCFICCMNISD